MCRYWKNIVTRHTDPASWGSRMWSKDAQLPRDRVSAAFSFSGVILFKVALDWG